MGAGRREQEEKEAAWDRLARANDYRCSSWGELITYDDREHFFETKECNHCTYVLNKDD